MQCIVRYEGPALRARTPTTYRTTPCLLVLLQVLNLLTLLFNNTFKMIDLTQQARGFSVMLLLSSSSPSPWLRATIRLKISFSSYESLESSNVTLKRGISLLLRLIVFFFPLTIFSTHIIVKIISMTQKQHFDNPQFDSSNSMVDDHHHHALFPFSVSIRFLSLELVPRRHDALNHESRHHRLNEKVKQ